MSGTELRQAVEVPAMVVGLTLEEGLVDPLLADLGAGRRLSAPGARCCNPSFPLRRLAAPSAQPALSWQSGQAHTVAVLQRPHRTKESRS